MSWVAPAVRWRLLLLLLLVAILRVEIVAQRAGYREAVRDWPQFGYDAQSSGAYPTWTGITAANTASLTRRQVTLDGTVDASAIYLHAAVVNGLSHDVFFVTTAYGKTIAIDADSGSVLWEYRPSSFASLAGTAQITNSTPAADPDRQHIYAAAPDGTVQKLAIADGHVVWTTSITLLPSREKIASPLKVFNGRVIAVTGGYIGDAPPYQGHVAVLDSQSGSLLGVWNSLCSDQAGLLQPSSCQSTRSAIWGRAGAVIDPATGDIFVATGNGPYDGKTNWGDSLIELDPGATHVLANYTPTDNATLNNGDLDLGSTSPVLLGAGVLAQGGKDMLIRLLSLPTIAGLAPHSGGELQNVSTPSKSMMFTALAVWQDQGQTWMFGADNGATAAWTSSGGKLTPMWSHSTAGTSPVVAGGLLYVYNPNGGLQIYDPTSGTQVANLSCGSGHWNSPIVADGRIALPEGNANQHAASGVLDIWTAPLRRVENRKKLR
jgi:outer membrane protein assembly factor BamB